MQTEIIDRGRRRLIGAAALGIAAAQLGVAGHANAQAAAVSRGTGFPGAMKQARSGVLDMGYAEAGVPNGPAVILLHGWPYDIHSFVEIVSHDVV